MSETIFDLTMLASLIAASVRLATPIAFAALGGLIAERSGVYNIALEGLILAGALAAAAGSQATGSPWWGLVAAAATGAFGGLLVAVLIVSFRINQLVAGIAVNILCGGLTAFLAHAVFGLGSNTQVPGLPADLLGALSEIPWVGQVFFGYDPLTYTLLFVCLAFTAMLYLSHLGLALRAAGENAQAADSAGLPVISIRYWALATSGVLASLGGAQLVLAQVYVFSDGMSAGKGFLALAAIILGRWHPVGVAMAALFFGVCEALQFRLQFAIPEVPYQLFQILPYAVSIFALIFMRSALCEPKSLGKLFYREER